MSSFNVPYVYSPSSFSLKLKTISIYVSKMAMWTEGLGLDWLHTLTCLSSELQYEKARKRGKRVRSHHHAKLSQCAVILAPPELMSPPRHEDRGDSYNVRCLSMKKSPTVSQYGVGESLHRSHGFNIWHVAEAKHA